MIWHRVYFKGIKNGNFSVDDAPGRTLCVFITAGPGTKLCVFIVFINAVLFYKASKTENETANELKNTVQKTRSKHSLASPVSLEGALGGRQDIAKLRVGCTGEFWRPCVVTGVLLLRPALGLAFPIFNPSCCRFQCFMLQGPHVADGSSLRVGSKLAATHPVHACASVRCVASRHPTRWLPWFLCGVLPPAEAVTRLTC